MKTENYNLSHFNFISLDDLKKVRLLDRKDTKFVFNKSKLPVLLDKIKSSFQVLNIEGVRNFKYENTYFDTDDFLFYQQHHNEKRNRFKVRFRKYSTTEDCYFEIKMKNNKNRTIKNRIQVDGMNNILDETQNQLITKITGLPPKILNPKISIQFSRITLADNEYNERLTIDTGLSVKNGKNSMIFDQLVISEIKQKKYNPKSDYIQILRNLKIPEMRFSKYCMGMLHVYKKIKYNRFKPKLIQINKILTQE